jgi:hypothetical protein
MESMVAVVVGAKERGCENSKSDCMGMVAVGVWIELLAWWCCGCFVEFLDVAHWSLVGGFAEHVRWVVSQHERWNNGSDVWCLPLGART